MCLCVCVRFVTYECGKTRKSFQELFPHVVLSVINISFYFQSELCLSLTFTCTCWRREEKRALRYSHTCNSSNIHAIIVWSSLPIWFRVDKMKTGSMSCPLSVYCCSVSLLFLYEECDQVVPPSSMSLPHGCTLARHSLVDLLLLCSALTGDTKRHLGWRVLMQVTSVYTSLQLMAVNSRFFCMRTCVLVCVVGRVLCSADEKRAVGSKHPFMAEISKLAT